MHFSWSQSDQPGFDLVRWASICDFSWDHKVCSFTKTQQQASQLQNMQLHFGLAYARIPCLCSIYYLIWCANIPTKNYCTSLSYATAAKSYLLQLLNVSFALGSSLTLQPKLCCIYLIFNAKIQSEVERQRKVKEDKKETKGYPESNMDICTCRFHMVSGYLEGRREQSNTDVHLDFCGWIDKCSQ